LSGSKKRIIAALAIIGTGLLIAGLLPLISMMTVEWTDPIPIFISPILIVAGAIMVTTSIRGQIPVMLSLRDDGLIYAWKPTRIRLSAPEITHIWLLGMAGGPTEHSAVVLDRKKGDPIIIDASFSFSDLQTVEGWARRMAIIHHVPLSEGPSNMEDNFNLHDSV